jgi:NADH-quinone oxidoreductase subunit I
MIRCKVVPRPRTLGDEIYLPAIVQGLGVTLRHFFRNLISRKDTVTVEYPGVYRGLLTSHFEPERTPYPPRNRGLHRLMRRPDGRVRCVACMCCPTVCPAHCITIVPAESDDPAVEKYPRIFEIDELRCVVCGLCVEACPCDAIRMDTGVHCSPVTARSEAVLDKDALLGRSSSSVPSMAVQGGRPDWWARLEAEEAQDALGAESEESGNRAALRESGEVGH